VVGSRLLIPTVAGRLGTVLGRGIEATDEHYRHRLRQAIAVLSRADHSSRPRELVQTTKSWRGYSDFPAISSTEDNASFFRLFNGFCSQSDRSTTHADRDFDRKVTRLHWIGLVGG
jgi:hypothetical protein